MDNARPAIDPLHEVERLQARVDRLEAQNRALAGRVDTYTSLSTERFWETDDQLRFVVLDASAADAAGRCAWDTESVDPGHPLWIEHRERLARREPFHRIELPIRMPDGEVQWLQASGKPFYDAEGRFRGYRGVCKWATSRRRAEAQLQESLDRFRSLTELSSDWYWEQDSAHRFTYFDGRSTILKGLAAQAIGKRRWDLPSFLVTPEQLAEHQRALGAHEPFYDFEYRALKPDGNFVWMSISGLPIFDADGSFRGYRGIGKDITAKKLAADAIRESEARFRMLSELSSDWYWQTDAEHRFVALEGNDANRATVASSSSIGKPRWELPIVNVTAEQWAEHRYHLDTHLPIRDFEYQRIGETGELHWVSVSGLPFFDDAGKFLGYRGVGRNISAQKASEALLRKAKDEAEAANHAKSQFVANMSHEIRTPMNAIMGMSELALSLRPDSEVGECIATIKDSADWLLGIINTILDFSKIEAGKIELEQTPFALAPLIANTLKSFGATAADRGLALGCSVQADVPNELVGDPTRLREIIVNLVGNAIKFTAAGAIDVRVALAARSGTTYTLRFEISDTGIGIPAGKLETIFDPFAQGDASTTRKYGGTGLGLTICARLVQLMGGAITVESEVGRGTTFRFTVPFSLAPEEILRPADAHALDAGAERDRAAVPLDILLVEDNAVNQRLAERMLRRAGHSVTIAANGVAAIATLARRSFDLILMDMQMPEMGGVEATARIRALEAAGRPRTPIIAMTANAMASDRAECLAVGMDDYISKPIQWREAHALIARAVARGEGSRRAPVD